GNRIDFSRTTNSLILQHSCGTSLLLEHEGEIGKPSKAYVSDDLYVLYTYDGDGNLTGTVRHVDGEEHAFTYEYDADGIMTNKTNPRGDEYRFTHDHYMSEDADGEDNVRTTTLEIGDGWMKHEVVARWGHSSGSEYRYSDVVYDYGNGLEKKYHYETGDGLIQTMHGPYTDAMGVVTNMGVSYTYDRKNVATEKTFDDTLGESFTIHRQYDDLSHVTALGVSYNSDVPVWQRHVSYDPGWNLPAAITNAEGHWTQTVYTNGRPLAVKAFWSDTQSHDTTFAYYTNGLVKAMTNANQHATQMEYDANGNLSLVQPPVGPQVETVFNALGQLERSETLTENGSSIGRITQYDINAKGWVRSVVYPDGLGETFAHDNAGNITNTVDRAGRTTDFAYAPTKKLTSVTRYLSEGGANTPVRIAYDFDKMFNALSITEPRGRYVETYQLDLQDRVAGVTNIEGQAMGIEYYVGDFVKSITRFDGSVVSNGYDQAGRLDFVGISNSEQGTPNVEVNYTYWPDGETKTVSDGFSAITNSYDRLNRLTNIVVSASSAVQYQYDPVGNPTNSVVSAGGSQASATAYAYDAAERLTEISRKGAEAQSFAYGYSPVNGRVVSVANSESGLTCSYEYDLLDRATNIAYRAGDGTLIRSLDYEYDAASMIIQKRISNSEQGTPNSEVSYVYDSLDRLVHESTSTNGHSLFDIRYSYDLAGNRLSKTSKGWKSDYTLGVGNRLSSASTTTNTTLFVSGTASEFIGTDERWGELWITNHATGAGSVPSVNGNAFFAELPALGNATNTIVAAIRDHAGNMGYATNDVFVSSAGGTSSSSSYAYDTAGCLTNLNGVLLEWDERYRLKSVDNVEYEYDVLTRRTSRIEGGTTNFFVYNGNQVAADLDGSGNLLRTYVWGMGIDNLLCFTDHTSSNTYYAIKDHQNTVIAMVDETGSVVESYEYDAYGQILAVKDGSGNSITNQQSSIGNRYTFQGREIDWATGLYHFRARWYDPETGRWLSKDPIGISGGLNLYEAFGNNPVSYIDPFGRAPGDPYSSPEAAATAASGDIYGSSLANDVEMGGYITPTEGGYTYTSPVTGEQHHVDLGRKPDGTVGYYHSHGRESGPKYSDEKFGGGDQALQARLGTRYGFVVTPSGKIIRNIYRGGNHYQKEIGNVKGGCE
ncbi:MAG: RHS repeat-associated core domain-containing protein, partial [Verrucomicrobiota bacterium]|nr:RHS repeat-associated core domain-containing protein [Verrucomicrobiota bacterium]